MFDTVAWWYRTEPCSTSAPVSVLGPWLLPPALTDLLHGITMTLCTHKARVGGFFNYFRDACLGNTRMSHVCRLHVRRGRSESTAATSQARVCGTCVEGDRRAAPFLCLFPSSSKPAQGTAPPSILWRRTFIHGTLPCTGLLHCSCGSPTLPGLAGFSGSRFAGGSEAG